MNPFIYPAEAHRRRHGPSGYAGYESYRDWLRDEFSFRCVYCLNREQWVIAKGSFAIDHFIPVSLDPRSVTRYENLLYACAACNLTRGNQPIPNPLEHLLASTVEVQPNGEMVTRTAPAQEIVETMQLNDSEYVFRRQQMLVLFAELEKRRPDLHREWLAYPSSLPDLARLRPPGGNKLPKGIFESYFVLRMRGEFPAVY